MLKRYSFVMLLTTLGIVSSGLAQGLSSEQGNTDTTINIKIHQICCGNQLECSIMVAGKTCNGTFKVVLETTHDVASRPMLPSGVSSKLKPLKPGEREIPITVDTKSELLRTLEEILGAQYGALKQSTNKPVEQDQPQKILAKPKKVIEPDSREQTSIEEEDQPRPIWVKPSDVTFTADYSDNENKKIGFGEFPQPYYLPDFVEPEAHEPVNPIGFNNSTEIDKIRLEVLYKANYYRSIFGMRHVTLNTNMNHYSQDWANQMAQAADHLSINCTLVRSKTIDGHIRYGENLFTSLPVKHVGEVAVDTFYYEAASIVKTDENNDFKMFKNDKTQRLTQLLWKVSQQIGVGAAVGDDGKYYVVVNFNPFGNVEHFMKQNIPIFTQQQIDDAKEKIAKIDEKSDKFVDHWRRRVTTLPGWTSMLYRKIRKYY